MCKLLMWLLLFRNSSPLHQQMTTSCQWYPLVTMLWSRFCQVETTIFSLSRQCGLLAMLRSVVCHCVDEFSAVNQCIRCVLGFLLGWDITCLLALLILRLLLFRLLLRLHYKWETKQFSLTLWIWCWTERKCLRDSCLSHLYLIVRDWLKKWLMELLSAVHTRTCVVAGTMLT